MKLTASTVKTAQIERGKSEQIFFDDDIPGFGVRLRPHSATYIFRYRDGARQPRVTIGKVSAITAQKARAEAAKLYAQVRLGDDPAGDRAEARVRVGDFRSLQTHPHRK